MNAKSGLLKDIINLVTWED